MVSQTRRTYQANDHPPYFAVQTRLGIRRRSLIDPLLHKIYVGG